MAAVIDNAPQPDRIDPWGALAQASTAEQLCRAWLDVLCRGLVDADAGLLLMAQADGAFAPVATHPADRDMSPLREIATTALKTRDSVVLRDGLGQVQLAYPLLSGQTLQGAVVLHLGRAPQQSVDQALRLVNWGAGWLVGLLHQRDLADRQRRLRQGGFLLDMLLGLLAEDSPREAALSLVNRLGREFDSPLVHLALAEGRTLRLLALSHAAWFDTKAGLLRQAIQAMHEAMDQRTTIVWSTSAPSATAVVTDAHRRYAQQVGAATLVSLPLLHEGAITGVLMLERQTPFSPDDIDYLESIALGLSPALMLQREAHQGAAGRASRTARRALQTVWGPRFPALKLGLGIVAVAVLLLAVIPVRFRISSQALVEGAVQRAAVAPFEGYLRAAPVRAGDIVRTGQVLATLDDRDLKLERVRWESELEVSLRKEREAMASGNAAEQRLAGAQANQARAQLDLAVSKLERVNILAPFDGTVVKGDLTQQLGSPVELGKVLFELAPLDDWRVILKIDERDIGQVHVGAAGELVLASLPGQAWPFTVKKLTPVSIAEDGRNHFRVEAELGPGAPRLRPNMEGVGKVDAGHASLLWIWSRPLRDWARLTWWRLMP
jgi:multidrug resistance efflux pump